MSFVNSTRFIALDVPTTDPIGREVVVAIVKATFDIRGDGRLVPAEAPAPVRLNDELTDPEKAESSLRLPSDVCIEKQGTDVVVIGEACSRAPVPVVDVVVKARDLSAPLRVHGERVFYQSLGGVVIGPAAPFERKPITYERAYGGGGNDHDLLETRNPAGVGVARRASDLVDRPAPQIEHPERPHTSASDKHPPMGYGALRSHWSPRREFAGTFDDAWRQSRSPLLPADFDIRFNNVAHPSLIVPRPLAPGDAVAILGMSMDGLIRFEVPALPIMVRARFDQSARVEVRPPLDTVLVEPSRRRVELTFRKAFSLGRGKDVLREIRVEPD